MAFLIERIIVTLSPKEHKQFTLWLTATIDEKNSLQLRLWMLLSEEEHFQCLRTPLSHAARWKWIAADLYPGDPDPTSKLEKIRGKLQKRLETLLAIHALLADEVLTDTLTLRALINKQYLTEGKEKAEAETTEAKGKKKNEEKKKGKQEKNTPRATTSEEIRHFFPIIYKKAQKRLEQAPLRDASYFQARAERAQAMQEYEVQHVPPVEHGKYRTERITMWLESLRCGWFELDLHDAQEALQPLAAFACAPFEPNAPAESPEETPPRQVAALHYHLRQLRNAPHLTEEIRGEMETALINDLAKYRPALGSGAYATLHTCVFNYFAAQSQTEVSYRYYRILYHFFEQGHALNIWSVSPRHYHVICLIYAGLCLLGKKADPQRNYLDAFETHVRQYAEYLPKDQREDARIYNEALYHFCKGEYAKVKQLVNTPVFRDPDYEMNHQLLMVQAAYEEKKPLSQLRADIRATRQKVDEKAGIHEQKRTGGINQLTLMRKLLSIQTLLKAQKLHTEIAQTQPLSNRVWLTLKAEELIEKFSAPTE